MKASPIPNVALAHGMLDLSKLKDRRWAFNLRSSGLSRYFGFVFNSKTIAAYKPRTMLRRSSENAGVYLKCHQDFHELCHQFQHKGSPGKGSTRGFYYLGNALLLKPGGWHTDVLCNSVDLFVCLK